MEGATCPGEASGWTEEALSRRGCGGQALGRGSQVAQDTHSSPAPRSGRTVSRRGWRLVGQGPASSCAPPVRATGALGPLLTCVADSCAAFHCRTWELVLETPKNRLWRGEALSREGWALSSSVLTSPLPGGRGCVGPPCCPPPGATSCWGK